MMSWDLRAENQSEWYLAISENKTDIKITVVEDIMGPTSGEPIELVLLLSAHKTVTKITVDDGITGSTKGESI